MRIRETLNATAVYILQSVAFVTLKGLQTFKEEQDRENDSKYLKSVDLSQKANLSDVPIMMDADGNIVLRKDGI